MVTASRRGIAWPPINLKSFTAVNASAIPSAPRQSQQQALRGYLPEKGQSANAQGAAHGIFLLPLQSADQQQGSGIPASYKEDQRGSSE